MKVGAVNGDDYNVKGSRQADGSGVDLANVKDVDEPL